MHRPAFDVRSVDLLRVSRGRTLRGELLSSPRRGRRIDRHVPAVEARRENSCARREYRSRRVLWCVCQRRAAPRCCWSIPIGPRDARSAIERSGWNHVGHRSLSEAHAREYSRPTRSRTSEGLAARTIASTWAPPRTRPHRRGHVRGDARDLRIGARHASPVTSDRSRSDPRRTAPPRRRDDTHVPR